MVQVNVVMKVVVVVVAFLANGHALRIADSSTSSNSEGVKVQPAPQSGVAWAACEAALRKGGGGKGVVVGIGTSCFASPVIAIAIGACPCVFLRVYSWLTSV